MAELTAERLRELLHYDPETGVFTWKVERRCGRGGNNVAARAGDVAGCTRGDTGYRVIRIDDVMYRAHRLVWLYVTGTWPAVQIDHINGVRGDNRLVNLREANHSENKWNTGRRRHNTSGFKGVSWARREKKWEAYIGKNRRKMSLGYFTTAEEAHAAYCRAAEELHGEFARTA